MDPHIASFSNARGRRSKTLAAIPKSFDGAIGVFAGVSNEHLSPSQFVFASGTRRAIERTPAHAWQRQGLFADARFLQTESARAEPEYPDRMLDLARRGLRCVSESFKLRM